MSRPDRRSRWAYHLYGDIAVIIGKGEVRIPASVVDALTSGYDPGNHHMPVITQRFRQCLHTGCVDPIIVTQQYTHNHPLC